ncbi:unnamed protein product [Parnassius apollo]|uniref:(apollo) hypothetical protein n=1 Tax=Parnassius apollo TaxID=110799 RepID=A0A8S3WQB1_PARAO|nr:unnamed protein product [Parnassius apollo]
MNNKRRYCKCSSKKKNSRKKIQFTDCKNVKEIIEALLCQEDDVCKSKSHRRAHFKTKSFKPRHYKDTCVPMTPSMHTRLRYIGHCPLEPAKPLDWKTRQAFTDYEFVSSSEDDDESGGILRLRKKSKYKKKVRYYDLLPGDIYLPTPPPVIKHTSSDQSILNVASPKISGEVISAQRASVHAADLKPPLPPESGYKLIKPHSGIIINADKDYILDIPEMPGYKLPGGKPLKKKTRRKSRICKKTCTQKKSRKCAEIRRRQRQSRNRSHLDVPYTIIGVTDGKPRARGTQKHLKDDDSVCGLDEIPKPEHVHIPKNLKRGTLRTHSLTVLPCTKRRRPDIHYGILTGSFNMYDNKFGNRSRGRQALTMSVMAYCLAFHYHPKQWTIKLVDNLLEAGDQWYVI